MNIEVLNDGPVSIFLDSVDFFDKIVLESKKPIIEETKDDDTKSKNKEDL
jgi:hypothetical protein